ncbi:unnamed protein product, partial [marine sediment metagenome]
DALWTFDLGVTITTGDPLTFGVNRIDNGADLLDGEMIGADTIDDDSIDWADCTLADFDFENTWMMFHSDAAGDVQDVAIGAVDTFLASTGVAANPAFRLLADGDIPNDITIDLAAAASAVAYDDISDPDAASTIDFGDDERVTWTIAEDSAASFFTINNSDAALAANTYLLHLLYSVDDDEANADYFKCEDAGGVVFSIQQDGDTITTGDLDLSNRTSTLQTGTIIRQDIDCTLQPAGGLAGATYFRGIDVLSIWDSDQDGETQDGYITAGNYETNTFDAGSTGNLHSLRTIRVQSYHYGTGTVGQQIGVISEVYNDDTSSEDGDITAAYNYIANAYTDKGTGTVGVRYGYYAGDMTGAGNLTNQYGALIKDMTGATNDYGIAIEGADTYALWVSSAADNADAANGITFGASGDTNLY